MNPLDYISKSIETEIKKIIKEQEEEEQKSNEEILATFQNMDTFVKDEKKQSDANVKNSMKLMSALTDPTKRSAEGLNMKVQKDRIKKLDTMKKSVEDQQKSFEDNLKKQQTQSQIKQQTVVGQEAELSEDFPALPVQQPEQQPRKAFVVNFDKGTQEPFQVKFTERGFAIGGTRLSFEAIENAISKNYAIILDNGKGFVLDGIRMQKILKYKDKVI